MCLRACVGGSTSQRSCWCHYITSNCAGADGGVRRSQKTILHLCAAFVRVCLHPFVGNLITRCCREPTASLGSECHGLRRWVSVNGCPLGSSVWRVVWLACERRRDCWSLSALCNLSCLWWDCSSSWIVQSAKLLYLQEGLL